MMVKVKAIIYLLISLKGVFGITDISGLYEKLFSNYSSEVLPKCNNTAAVQVKIGLALRQIIDLNEPRQILETNTWIRLAWNDCQLKWNETEFGISNMVVPNKATWIPDITLYDNAENVLGGLSDFRPNIYSDGSVYYNFPSVIKSLCKVDVTYFPFDTQTCKMKFGSWSYHGLDLNVSRLAITGDTASYQSNGEWEIVGIPTVRHVLLYACCPEPYPDVTFYLQLERKPLFYLLNLMFPCMLISTMGFLGFLLPPDSGEKVSLEITVLLSLAVFLLVVSETMPPTSETFPYIGVYFACAMLLVSLSCLMTVTVLNTHFKGQFGKKMSPGLRHVFLHVLGRLLRVKVDQDTPEIIVSRNNRISAIHDHNLHTNGEEALPNGITVVENNLNKSMNDMKEMNTKCNVTELCNTPEAVSLLQDTLQCLKNINSHIEDRKQRDAIVEDWQKLAQVVDRIFMVLFSIFQITTTLAIMLKASTSEPDFSMD